MALENSVPDTDTGLADETTALLGKCTEGLDVFGHLHELAEDMRVLSLNAELAAGRAGDKGASVRVLTQYTRELVFRLDTVDKKIKELRKELNDASRSNNEDGTGTAKETPDRTLVRIDAITRCATGLADATKDVSGVGSHASSISTNIAIEAALSGQYEAEFNQVAISMQGYVEQLAGMSDSAIRITRGIIPEGRVLRERIERDMNRTTTGKGVSAPILTPASGRAQASMAETPAPDSLTVTEATSLFTRLGGEPAIDVVVDVMFTRAMEDTAVAGFLEGSDMDHVKQTWKSFLTAGTGGPGSGTDRHLTAILTAWQRAGLEDRHLDMIHQHLENALKSFQVAPDIIDGIMEVVRRISDTAPASGQSQAVVVEKQAETPPETPIAESLIVTETASLFTRLGGEPAIDIVVGAMFSSAAEDSAVAGFLERSDMAHVQQTWKSFLTTGTGGPGPNTDSQFAAVLDTWRSAGLEDRHLDMIHQHLENALKNFQVAPDIIAGVMEVTRQTAARL